MRDVNEQDYSQVRPYEVLASLFYSSARTGQRKREKRARGGGEGEGGREGGQGRGKACLG